MLLRFRRSLLFFSALLLFSGLQFARAATEDHLYGPTPGSSVSLTLPLQKPAFAASQPLPAYCKGFYYGDTSTGSNQTDHYSCRPNWAETGPEQYYLLRTTTSQPLTITLSHPVLPSLDLDLFLLEDGDPARCFGSDAALTLPALAAGDHLIVVEGFDGSQGPYILTVDCSEPPLATATPTHTATLTPTHTPSATPTTTPVPSVFPSPTPTRARLTYDHYLLSQRRDYPPATPIPTTRVLQQGLDGYEGAADTYLDAWAPTTNYANTDRLWLRQSDIMAPLLRFSLEELPANAHIVEAHLELWAISQTNANPATVGLYQINRDWEPTTATWQQAAQTVPWEEAGANASPADRAAHPYSVQNVAETNRWFVWEVTSLVRLWLNQPASQHGVIFKAIAEPKVLYTFASSNHPTSSLRPKLTLQYWIAPPPANATLTSGDR